MNDSTIITSLAKGDRFYFISNPGEQYTVLGFSKNRNGVLKSVKCFRFGKLLPVYMSLKHEVIRISYNQSPSI